METREPGWGTAPGARATRMDMGQPTNFNDQTQPMGWAPGAAPARTPPTTPPTQGLARAGWAPTGGALWMAFVFGLACALGWSLFSLELYQIAGSLIAATNSAASQPLVELLVIVLDLAIPIAVLWVAWRGRGMRRPGGFVGAFVTLLALALAPGALLYALSLAAPASPLAAQLASLIVPNVPLAIFAGSPVFALEVLATSSLTLTFAAVYAWGGIAPSATRWLALVRWVVVGLSANLGAAVYGYTRYVILTYFYAEAGQAPLQQTLLKALEQFDLPRLLIYTVVGALLGGALIGGGDSSYDPASEGVRAALARRPLGWGRLIGLGALMFALGLLSSLWLPAMLVISAQAVTPPPDVAFVGLAALVPTIILVFALRAVFRQLGARAGWGALGLAALSYLPLLLEALVFVLARRVGANDVLGLLISDAPVALAFGVGVALAAALGANDPIRWRRRATAIGALVGVGYAGVYVGLAVAARLTPPGPCSGFGGCVLEAAFQIGIPTFLIAYGAEGLGFALVGATVGGWLRARAPRAPAGRFTDIAG